MNYLGDEYLQFSDIMEIGDPIQKVARYAGLGIVNLKYIAYENGEKENMIKQIAFHIGINKVLKTDPKKYIKIWNCKDPKFKYERKIKLTVDDMDKENIEKEPKVDIYN